MTTVPAQAEYLPVDYLTRTTEKYNAYQRRYAEEPRESDKVLIRLLSEALSPPIERGERLSVLDIGCSTGNLLFHLRRALPALDLHGGDLAPGAIGACRTDPRLAGIRFEVMDILDLPPESFDAVVANAVTYFFDDERYRRAASSVAASLHEGGTYVSFEFLHGFEQHLRTVEVSRSHPDGLGIYMRPFFEVEEVLRRSGFDEVSFHPFAIPIDLEQGGRYTDDTTGIEDLNTYTVTTESGERLLFRGVLYQPWCHLVARRR